MHLKHKSLRQMSWRVLTYTQEAWCTQTDGLVLNDAIKTSHDVIAQLPPYTSHIPHEHSKHLRLLAQDKYDHRKKRVTVFETAATKNDWIDGSRGSVMFSHLTKHNPSDTSPSNRKMRHHVRYICTSLFANVFL